MITSHDLMDAIHRRLRRELAHVHELRFGVYADFIVIDQQGIGVFIVYRDGAIRVGGLCGPGVIDPADPEMMNQLVVLVLRCWPIAERL